MVVVVGSWLSVAQSQDAVAPGPGDIQLAIERARDYLVSRQNNDGSWDALGSPDKRPGATALVMLALANAGEAADRPVMRRGLDWLRRHNLEDTHSVSLQTMVLAMLSPDADRALLERNVAWLEQAQVRQGPGSGSWTYTQARGAANGDNSNSQFALLALHEAARAGVRVREETWVRAQQYWVACNNPDGSWGYSPGSPAGTGSMTCAGIASIWITAEHLGRPDATAKRGDVLCCGGGAAPRNLEKGLEWLGRRFTVRQNPGTGGDTWLYYYLYGLERVGRFTARRYIGDHDWYREGAGMFVQQQDRLTGKFVADRIEDATVATSFALLFLAKGRRPVLVAKSRHDGHDIDDWNRHGHDIAHLIDWVEARWRKTFPAGISWQVIDTTSASPDDLHQAPVLWISGRDAFQLGQDAGRRLRAYIGDGGFIFAEACCPKSAEFDRRFRQLIHEMFPEPNGELRVLPEDHPIWTEATFIPPNLRRPMEFIEIDGRTCVIYAPPTDLDPDAAGMPSLSCLWELGGPARAYLPPAAARGVDAALQLGENILSHAVQSSPMLPAGLGALSNQWGNLLVGLPPSDVKISDRELSEKLVTARGKFNDLLAEQRTLVRSEIDKAAASCAHAKDLVGLEKWETALREFDSTFSRPPGSTQGLRIAYLAAHKQIAKALRELERCYGEVRDALTEVRKTSEARAVEDERGRFFVQ